MEFGSIMENRIKYLEMIESVIQRMANNCFQLKGWAITLVTLVGALAAQGTDKRFILLAFIPIIAFWGLDSYYLQLERKYRIFYSIILKRKTSEIDFNMDLKAMYPLNDAQKQRVGLIACILSKSEILFYLPIMVAVIAITIVIF